jgi:hypothetical protein
MSKFVLPEGAWHPLYEIAPQARNAYEIVTAPVGLWATRWTRMCEAYAAQRPGGIPLMWPREGVFMWKGYAATGTHPAEWELYDPRAHREAIFTEVRNLDPDQPDDLLRFVNHWGVLGVGNPVMGWNPVLFPFDSVAVMAEWVRMRQVVLSAYLTLRVRRPRRWADVADVLGPSFGAGVWSILQDPEARVTWPLLAEALNHLVGPLRHHVMAEGTRLRPVYALRSLADLINLELWRHVTLGKDFRRCAGCQDAFLPSRPNQAYHSVACGNKARQQARRDRQRTPRPSSRRPSRRPARPKS